MNREGVAGAVTIVTETTITEIHRLVKETTITEIGPPHDRNSRFCYNNRFSNCVCVYECSMYIHLCAYVDLCIYVYMHYVGK